MAIINGLDTKYDIKIIEKISSDALYFPSVISPPPFLLSAANNNNNDSSKVEEDNKTSIAASSLSLPLLKSLEDMLHNNIKHKKEQVHKTKNIAENDKLSIEIDTLHWVLSQSLSIRRLLKGQESELRYDTTTITKGLMMRRGNKKRKKKSYHSNLILNFN